MTTPSPPTLPASESGPESETPQLAGRKEWTALAVLALPLLLVSMDVSVLLFAVPYLTRDLGASATQQLWIFDIYGFVLAGLLITMGALGDRIGRRRLLLCGAAAFGLASLAAAYAGTPQQLVAARAVLGVGGATLMPSTLALVRNMFHDPQQRSRAIGVWTAVMMSGIALGPVLSGILLEHFWWGSVFLMNLPAMVLLLVLAPALVPEFKPAGSGRFDILSSLLSLGAVLPVVYGVKRAAVDGVGPGPVAFVIVGLVGSGLFLRRQRTCTSPMVDPAMFGIPAFGGAVAANVVAMFALVGNSVFLTQYLQLVLGLSPLRAALWSLAPSVVVGGAAPLATSLGQRINRARVMAVGFLVGATGFAVMTQARSDSPLTVVLVGASLLSFGLVGVLALVTELVMGSISPERAGTASAITETSGELGGSLGIALLGSLGAFAYRNALDGPLASALPAGGLDSVRDGLAGAVAAAGRTSGPAGNQILHAGRDAFMSGMHVVEISGAAVLVAAAAVTLAVSRTPRVGGR